MIVLYITVFCADFQYAHHSSFVVLSKTLYTYIQKENQSTKTAQTNVLRVAEVRSCGLQIWYFGSLLKPKCNKQNAPTAQVPWPVLSNSEDIGVCSLLLESVCSWAASILFFQSTTFEWNKNKYVLTKQIRLFSNCFKPRTVMRYISCLYIYIYFNINCYISCSKGINISFLDF